VLQSRAQHDPNRHDLEIFVPPGQTLEARVTSSGGQREQNFYLKHGGNNSAFAQFNNYQPGQENGGDFKWKNESNLTVLLYMISSHKNGPPSSDAWNNSHMTVRKDETNGNPPTRTLIAEWDNRSVLLEMTIR